MKLHDIIIGQGLIVIIYDVSYHDLYNDLMTEYQITLYDYNFKKLHYIHVGEGNVEELKFKFMIQEPRKSLMKRESKTKIKISLGYNNFGINDTNRRLYNYYDNIDADELLLIKKANEDKTIIFNNEIIIKYETNVVINILLLKYVLHELPLELHQEIKEILQKTSHTFLVLEYNSEV